MLTEGAGFLAPIDSQAESHSAPAPIFTNVHVERTRHGRSATYYRRGKGERLRLPDEIGSPEFVRAYKDVPRKFAERNAELMSRSITMVSGQILPTLRGAATRARMRGLNFELTPQWCVDTLKAQDCRCALTGLRFSLSGKGMRGRDPLGPSLDRIDCSEGYTTANTRIVVLAINIMLADWGEDVFQKIIAAYTKRRAINIAH